MRREELVIATYINEAKGKWVDIHCDGVGGTLMGKDCNHRQYCVGPLITVWPGTLSLHQLVNRSSSFPTSEHIPWVASSCGSPSRLERCTSAVCRIEVVRKDMVAFYLLLRKGHPIIDHEE